MSMLFAEKPSCRSRWQPYLPLVEGLEERTLLSFLAAPTYAVGSYPDSVAVGDFNGDRNLDLAVANRTRAGTLSVLLGNGDDSFLPARSYAVGSYPSSVTLGDFNGDGTTDL